MTGRGKGGKGLGKVSSTSIIIITIITIHYISLLLFYPSSLFHEIFEYY